MPVSEKAFAKINLLLFVKHKRPDGYHELETVYQSIALHDTLVFYTADDEQVSLSCDCPGLSVGEDNLALQAALMLKNTMKSGRSKNSSEKRIPLAAGLAGGSAMPPLPCADCSASGSCPARTACCKKLRRHWVPMCPLLARRHGFCYREGREADTARDCPTFFVVLANPGFAVSTAEVYRSLRTDDFKNRQHEAHACGLAER